MSGVSLLSLQILISVATIFLSVLRASFAVRNRG